MARKRLPVDFSETAEQDLRAIHEYIARDKPKAAARWVREAKRRINLLRTVPLGFEIMPEMAEFGIECRQILHGRYRIIYLVKRGRVRIIRILDAARILTPALLGLELPESDE